MLFIFKQSIQENRDNKTKKSSANPNQEYWSQSGDVCITTRPALSIDMSICTLNLKRILMQVRESLISSVRAGRESEGERVKERQDRRK